MTRVKVVDGPTRSLLNWTLTVDITPKCYIKTDNENNKLQNQGISKNEVDCHICFLTEQKKILMVSTLCKPLYLNRNP